MYIIIFNMAHPNCIGLLVADGMGTRNPGFGYYPQLTVEK